MALKECPDCGGEVSRTAKSCPHCGKQLPNVLQQGCGYGCLAVIVLVVVMALLSGL